MNYIEVLEMAMGMVGSIGAGVAIGICFRMIMRALSSRSTEAAKSREYEVPKFSCRQSLNIAWATNPSVWK